MDRSIFRFIWRHSRGQQITALILTVISFPFLYVSLDLPKTIINKAIDTTEGAFPTTFMSFDLTLFGTQLIDFPGFQMQQLPYLFTLCGFFLLLVFVNGGFKLKINTYKGVMSERLLRRLRYELLGRTLRFPLGEFQRTSQGEVVSMVTQEVEPLGGFFGDAFVLVAFQGGIFLTIMTFMFVQDPLLGLAAFAMIPVQGYIIPKMQKRVNELGKLRVREVRSLSGRVSEVVGGIRDIHANDASSYLLSDIGERLGRIFVIRFEIYQRKFFMKFVNNFLNQLTPFFFFTIGGYLVIEGDLTIGALVAALAAYKDLAAPWKELLNYYQRLADARIKYEAVTSQFDPPGMIPPELQIEPPKQIPPLSGAIEVQGVGVTSEDGVKIIDQVTFTIPPGSKTAFLSNNGTVKDTLALLLGRLIMPTNGKILVGGENMATMHEAVTGRRIAVLTSNGVFFNASIADNIFLGLQHSTPELKAEDDEEKTRIAEAEASGNSPYSFGEDWIDYELAGFSDRDALLRHTNALLRAFELDEEMYTIGLRQVIQPGNHNDLVEKILKARTRIREVLHEKGIDDLVRGYELDAFNTYASVGENLLFGEAVDPSFKLENLGSNPTILATLDEFGMQDQFLEVGLRCAEVMVELFQDLPAGHPFFEQYSFVDEEQLPDFKTVLRRADQDGRNSLSQAERNMVMELPFKLIPQRHRLGLITDDFQNKIVQMRLKLRDAHPEIFEEMVQPFDKDGFNGGMSILDNILFGRIMHGRADAAQRVLDALLGVVEELEMWDGIISAAFEFTAGIGGSRLSNTQRQKINLLRAVLKRPDILIVNEAMSSIDADGQARLVKQLAAHAPDASFIWIDSIPAPGIEFDQSFDIVGGRITSHAEEEGAAAAPAETEAEEKREEEGAIGSETKLLRELPLFANLDTSKLRLLAFTSDRMTYSAGEVVVKQGDQGDAAFVVLEGEAEVVLEGDNGAEQVLYVMKRGQVMGELAMLCDTPRSATVKARTDLTALRLNREVFVELARQDPYFSFEMTRDLGMRLLRTTAELNARR